MPLEFNRTHTQKEFDFIYIYVCIKTSPVAIDEISDCLLWTGSTEGFSLPTPEVPHGLDMSMMKVVFLLQFAIRPKLFQSMVIVWILLVQYK